jgi:hypothetical protein
MWTIGLGFSGGRGGGQAKVGARRHSLLISGGPFLMASAPLIVERNKPTLKKHRKEKNTIK